MYHHKELIRKVVIWSHGPASSPFPSAQGPWIWIGAWLPSLGENGLWFQQEGSSSGTSDPSHKGDSFFSFQGFKATYTKCHGLERGTHPPLSPAIALVLQEPSPVWNCSLTFVGKLNVMQTHEHLTLALERRFCTWPANGLRWGCFPLKYLNKSCRHKNEESGAGSIWQFLAWEAPPLTVDSNHDT